MMRLTFVLSVGATCVAMVSPVTNVQLTNAQETAEQSHTVTMNDGAVEFSAPKSWTRKKPRVNIIAHEFAVHPVDDDQTPGRLTVTAAMGTTAANIDRWIGQFQQPDGSPTKDTAKIEKKKIAEHEVHLVDISGTFFDQPRGPFGPKQERPGFRMLAAIVNVKDKGQYFLKLYGPAKTIAAEEKSFISFVESLEVK